MMTTTNITRVWIEQIEKVEVKESIFDGVDFAVRAIAIWTTKGDKYELNLVSDKVERLEFKKPDETWLTPKVYKGKSMHEEELG